jgi:hypothetical protein
VIPTRKGSRVSTGDATGKLAFALRRFLANSKCAAYERTGKRDARNDGRAVFTLTR